MWVSILQNGRKKDKENSNNKISQYIKLTEKSSYSTQLSKSALLSNKFQQRREMKRQKQNSFSNANRVLHKGKGTSSATNLLGNRINLMNSYLSDCNDAEPIKRMLKNNQQHNISVNKIRRDKQSSQLIKTQNEQNAQKKIYFFRLLHKKNRLRSQLNINIHNSIYTFKQFMKASLLCNPKPIDSRLPLQSENRKTIVFDMDETLIHTNENITPNYQIRVPFRSFQGRVGYGFVQVRPHCREVLKRLSQHFDIVIFTASTQAYADPIIDHIDPDKVVQFRLYRQSCSMVKNQVFVKDLRVLGRKLTNVVLVDNAPYSYMMQLDNGIPIIPYYRGKDDDQLLSLEQYLMKLKNVEDVRTVNKQYFKLHQYTKFDSHQKLVPKLYSQWVLAK